ncbi:serine/threonine-protein kinase Sgk1-like [Rhipicephalus sanguineus]|uniref:serine/threonine-protein kinase Sgk1-like n=2 Tax=Rhipicephalus sanguineus TaxID=34632 RepID=UPI0020C23842|nr:serine/threonine-protein kinase Sgk1-like [Rhipicephalus sanguineus]
MAGREVMEATQKRARLENQAASEPLQGQQSQQQQLGSEELSLLETLSTPFSPSDGVHRPMSPGRRRDVDTSTMRSSAVLPRRPNESAEFQQAQFLHMPRKLRESMSPQQREVYRDFQQQPSAFANSRRYCIPREKMHDPEVRASLLDYVRSVIEQAVDCAKVISTCALRDSQSRPNTLHKWDPKASVRNVPPPPMLNLPTVTLDRVRSRDEMETDTTAGSHGPRRGLRSPTMRFLSRLIPGRHSQSHAGSFSQSVCEKDEERSHMTMSMRSKPSSWKTLSIFSQIVEKPRLESLREWSFSRIVVIDILRTRKQDLVCSARHTFSGEWAILKIVWKRRFSSKRRAVARERKVWEMLSECQFVVGLKSFFTSSQCYVFVAEYYEGCTLQSLLEEGALRDDVIVNIVANVTYALKYIHDRDMMYRNISPTTILIDMKGTARLFDFAFCSHGKTSSSRIGSIPYMAPEVLRMEVYDRTSDYWSLGILTYVLYVRHTPMSIYSAKTNLDHWADRDYMYQYAEVVPIILPKHMPPHAKSLICGLLVERPRLRLGCRSTGFYEVMKHPFFHHVDWDSFTRAKSVTTRNAPKGNQSF